MSKQSISVRTTNVTVANACAEIISSATGTIRVTEIDIFMAGPAGATFGIGYPAAAGITPTTPVTLLLHDMDDQAAMGTVAVAWGTGPTVPANFLYRVGVPASTGSFISIQIPEGIVLETGDTLVVWNITTSDVADITFIVSTKQQAQTLAVI